MNTPPLPDDLPFRARINASPEVEQHALLDSGLIPNNTRLPLLIYRRVVRLPTQDPAGAFEQIFAHWNWRGQWRNGIYGFHHYHSTSHEVLGVYAGQVTVRMGGEGALGLTTALRAGDVVAIPAGVAHCNLESSEDFAVVGAYPDGCKWDLLRGREGERPQADVNIARLRPPTTRCSARRDLCGWRGGIDQPSEM